jgi:hypothetical protein
MADEQTKPGRITRVMADGQRINIDHEHELKDWSTRLGVTHWEVKAAVRKVGPLAKDVAQALGSNARI